ncbi:hypothetical protein I5907_21160 [Panacibacter sp. DH6]|uniref:Uncharacterized protein n=1 Tax=Panacibacter microcysteis TaxID=2793269 RepID=A0A931MDQ6_9BACT|nr:hypothetical protein [Panacibacter microcysteis]MBG9378755.1 hypothetical protein [Panacibacter microcysteis]
MSIYDYIFYNGASYLGADSVEGINKITQMAKRLSPLSGEIVRHRDGAVIINPDDTVKVLGFKDSTFRDRLCRLLGVSV